MVKLYKSKNYSLKDKAEIGFAIGKAYDDMKMPEEASKYLIFSNNQRNLIIILKMKYNFRNYTRIYLVVLKIGFKKTLAEVNLCLFLF